jgi:two-component system, OmpR family, alkaline phosphatase synthesis response regulator PhoP
MQTILVVEDDSSIAEIVVALLGDAGYKSVVVGNGQEALMYLEDGRADLILSDVMMPVMDGRELCRRLNSHSRHSSIPVILMSSAHNPKILEGCQYAAFLRKPFVIEEMLETVAALSNKKE